MTDGTSPRPWWAAAPPTASDGDRRCVICGTTLGIGDDPAPDIGSGPLCDACRRAREFDQSLWEQDLAEPDAGLW